MRMGGLKYSLAKQHDGEICESTRLQMATLSRLKLYSLRRWTFLRPPQLKPMVPRRIFPHPDTSYPLISLSIQPHMGHIRNASNTLLEPRVPVVPTVPVISTSMPQRETPGPLLAHPHPPPHFVSSRLPLARLLPLSPSQLGQSSRLSPATQRPMTTSRVGALDSRTWSWIPRPSCSTRFLHPTASGAKLYFWNGSSALDWVLLLRFNISNTLPMYTQSTPLSATRRIFPFLLNLFGITNASLHRASAPAPASLSLES